MLTTVVITSSLVALATLILLARTVRRRKELRARLVNQETWGRPDDPRAATARPTVAEIQRRIERSRAT